MRDGRAYTYFGPGPALPRIALNAVFPELAGRWSKLSLLAAVLTGMAAGIGLLRGMARTPRPGVEAGLAVALGVAATPMFLCARAFIHHEAVAWGATLALLTALGVTRYWRTGGRAALGGAVVAAALAFFTRPTTGTGALGLVAAVAAAGALTLGLGRRARAPRLAVLLAAVAGPRPRAAAWLGTVVVAATNGAGLFYTHLRFGDPFRPLPLELHVQYSPARLQKIGGTLIHWDVAPRTAAAYWLHPNVRTVPRFPWIDASRWGTPRSYAAYDYVEAQASILASMPVLFLMCVAGSLVAIHRAGRERDLRPVLLVGAMASGGALVLPYVVLVERFVHDFYPVLAVGAALAASVDAGGTWRRLRRVAAAAAVIGLVYSALVMGALAFTYQRERVYGVPPERRAQLEDFTAAADLARDTLLGREVPGRGAARRP
jgi:hypothetical protein